MFPASSRVRWVVFKIRSAGPDSRNDPLTAYSAIRSDRPANSRCYDPIAFQKRSDHEPYRSDHDPTWSCWRISSAGITHRVVTVMEGLAVRRLLRRRRFRPRRVLWDMQNPLETWTETVCYRYLRFTPATVLWLVRQVAPILQRPTNRNQSIPVLFQVVFGLHFLASNGFYINVCWLIGVSESMACRVARGFVLAVCQLRQLFVRWPTGDAEIRAAKQGFYRLNRKYFYGLTIRIMSF